MIGPGRFLSMGLLLLSFLAPLPPPAVAGTNATVRLVFAGDWVREFGEVTPEMIETLRAELWLQVSPSRPDGAERLLLSPQEVIVARRKYPEITTLAGNKMVGIQRLTLGTAPEFVEVGRNYVLFYEGVAHGAWGLVLSRRLRQAEAAMKKLTRQTLSRKVYIDEYEKTMTGERDQPAGLVEEKAIPGLEKSRIESYLDEAEKRFDTP
ncbi:MAG: hypothetical protein WCS52_10855 [bacterium]